MLQNVFQEAEREDVEYKIVFGSYSESYFIVYFLALSLVNSYMSHKIHIHPATQQDMGILQGPLPCIRSIPLYI